jgi:hypothetical protein
MLRKRRLYNTTTVAEVIPRTSPHALDTEIDTTDRSHVFAGCFAGRVLRDTHDASRA